MKLNGLKFSVYKFKLAVMQSAVFSLGKLMITDVLFSKLKEILKRGPAIIWEMLSLELAHAPIREEEAYFAPEKATDGSAGYDLKSPEHFSLEPGSSHRVDLNIALEIPVGWFGMIVPKSGLGTTYKVKLVNTVGVIDSDYRGEVKVDVEVPKNGLKMSIDPGNKFCQMLLLPAPYAKVVKKNLNELSNTERGDGGFGSTGK